MVETFSLAGAGASHLRSSPDLGAASASLPAGAYTTVRTYDGDGVPFLAEHLRRLEESTALQGHPGAIDREQLRSALATVLLATGYPESRIRITFAPPDLFASIEAFAPLAESLYETGVACVTVPLRRDTPHAKDTRFLSAAQGAYAALPAGVHEGLLVAEDGALLEGLSSNVFVAMNGVLHTEEARVLRGTTRAAVVDLARAVVPVSLEAVLVTDLPRASEVFLTSVSREVLAVVRVDAVAIGGGQPGPLARTLRERYRARMRTAAEHLWRG
jgi:branched-subunit amino acid aminotransferase/4-amino-4-deoxychorismate lyase